MRLLKKAAATMFCVAAMTTILSVGAMADMYNRTSKITFSGPVEIPGVHLKGYAVLPAGTYVFKLMDSQTNRHIVQIFNEDQTKCLATIMAIPNTRVKRTDKTVVTFRERPNGEPPALRAWFYPTAAWGEEFVYGKKKAKEMAQATNEPVLYNNSDNDENNEVAEIQAPKQADVDQMSQADIKAYTPTGDVTELSEVVTAPAPAELEAANQQPSMPPPAAPDNSADSTPAQLPQTSSPLGLVMLSGLLALVSGLGVRFARTYSR